MSLEYRRVSGLHVRTVPDRREGRVIADVMIYNKIDDYRTSFAPGVFAESLRDHLPKMLWAHNMMEPIGRWVEVDDNSQRLRMVGELDLDMVTAPDGRTLDIPAVPMAHRAWTQLQKRTIDQFSVGFVRLNDSPHGNVRGATQIDRAWLDEASPVLVGSVPGTQLIGTRAARQASFARERRNVFFFENTRGKVNTMTTHDEERANPVGYNQYKHMSGSTSPSAKKAAAASANDSAGAAYKPTQEAQYLREDYDVQELPGGKLQVDLDVDDAYGAKSLARKHGAQVKIVEEGGSGGANPVARFTGEPKKLDALLKAYDGGEQNASVASHNWEDM